MGRSWGNEVCGGGLGQGLNRDFWSPQPHAVAVELSTEGFQQLERSSGLSWSRTCLKPVVFPDLGTLCCLFSSDLPQPHGCSWRARPEARLFAVDTAQLWGWPGLRERCSWEAEPGLLPGLSLRMLSQRRLPGRRDCASRQPAKGPGPCPSPDAPFPTSR